MLNLRNGLSASDQGVDTKTKQDLIDFVSEFKLILK